MTFTSNHFKRPRASTTLFGVAVLAAVALSLATTASADGLTPVGLGLTTDYAVLAGSGISNTGATTISGSAGGDIGSSPTGTFTGSTLVTTSGTKFTAVNAQTTNAKADLVTAYDDAANRTSGSTISADLGTQTLTEGVYSSESSMGLTGTLTLDGQDNPNAVFIFQMGSTLTTASNSVVALINGAQACNVFWQVGSSATFGTTSDFAGHVLALTSITANTNATFHGQLLARNGAVTLDTNTIVNDVCAEVVPTESASPSATATQTTDTGGELPNTDTTNWAAPMLVGLASALAGTVVLWTRRRRG